VNQLSENPYEVRIAQLERAGRRDRAIALGVLAVVLVTAQATAPRTTSPVTVRDASGASATLTAAGLTIRDSSGTERFFGGLDDQGRPSLDLSDKTGELRESVYLFANDSFPTLRQFDPSGKRRMELRLDSGNDGELLINDANEKTRLGLYRTASGDPQIGLYGSDEKLRAYLSTDDDSPYLVMRDSTQTIRTYIGGYQGGGIGMDVRDADGKTLWKAP
jgi:uncharacterized protein (DUF1684 family)